MMRRPPTSTLPYTLVTDTTLFRSGADISRGRVEDELDLALGLVHGALVDAADRDGAHHAVVVDGDVGAGLGLDGVEIGRASCRERVCQSVYIAVVAVSLKQKNT